MVLTTRKKLLRRINEQGVFEKTLLFSFVFHKIKRKAFIMSGLLNYDNKIFTSLDKIINVFCISLLWIIFCIPVFTIGASTTAMYYTVNKVLRHGRGYVFKSFWSSFKTNFKQSTIIWLILLAVGLLFGADVYIMRGFAKNGSIWGKSFIFFTMMIVIELIWVMYIFPYIARFENSTKVILKNTAIISVANLPWTLLMAAVFAAFIVLDYCFPFMIIFIPAAFCWIQNLILEKIFRKYMTEEDIAAEDEKNRDYMN